MSQSAVVPEVAVVAVSSTAIELSESVAFGVVRPLRNTDGITEDVV